jgi:hypothetical protein
VHPHTGHLNLTTGATCPQESPMPYHDHPLTRAYILSTRTTEQKQLAESMRLIHQLELMMKPQEVAACKLAAEVLIERGQ